MTAVLAHVPEAAHEGAAQLLRLGALLPLVLVLVAAGLGRRAADPRLAVEVAALAAAGAIHLVVIPAHLDEGLVSAAVFSVLAMVELGLAWAAWAGRGGGIGRSGRRRRRRGVAGAVRRHEGHRVADRRATVDSAAIQPTSTVSSPTLHSWWPPTWPNVGIAAGRPRPSG